MPASKKEKSGFSALHATLRGVSKNPTILSGKDVIICVSVGQSIHYGERLKATCDLLLNINNELKKLHKEPIKSIILSANGILQRHNFWYFACNPNLPKSKEGFKINPVSDEELEKILKDVPSNITEKELANYLAEKFRPYAQLAEEAYINEHRHLIFDYRRNLLPTHFKIVDWARWINDERYSEAYDELLKNYEENTPFTADQKNNYHGLLDTPQENFHATSEAIFGGGNAKKITEAAARITKIRPELAHLDFNKVAHHASLTYLQEECPIIPGSLWKNHHIVYPNPMTPAFIATSLMTQNPVNWHILGIKSRTKQADLTPIEGIATISPHAPHIGMFGRTSSLSHLANPRANNRRANPLEDECKEDYEDYRPRSR